MKFVRFAFLALTPIVAAFGAVTVGAAATPFLLVVLGTAVLASIAPRLAHAPARVQHRR